MRSIAIAALAAITFLTSMLVGYAPANAVVCARGVYRLRRSPRGCRCPPSLLPSLSPLLSVSVLGRLRSTPFHDGL
jgi:hypothetical protein